MSRRLALVREAKLASLLAGAGGDRLEASGVLAAAAGLYGIFDNAPDVARIEATLSAAAGSSLIRQPRGRRQGTQHLHRLRDDRLREAARRSSFLVPLDPSPSP